MTSIAPTTLETERLILRPLEMSDVNAIYELAGHPDIAATTLNIPHPYPKHAAGEFVQHTQRAWESGDMYTFAIVRKSEAGMIGCISLGIPRMQHRAEMGYWMGVPYWGQGYTSEAAQELIDFGFRVVGLQKIYAMHFVENTASGRVMQKVGMTYEGTLRQHTMKNGELIDLAMYSILRAEYEGL